MRHKFLVLTVKKWLKSVYIYGSYRKIKTGVPLFLDHSVHQKIRTQAAFFIDIKFSLICFNLFLIDSRHVAYIRRQLDIQTETKTVGETSLAETQSCN